MSEIEVPPELTPFDRDLMIVRAKLKDWPDRPDYYDEDDEFYGDYGWQESIAHLLGCIPPDVAYAISDTRAPDFTRDGMAIPDGHQGGKWGFEVQVWLDQSYPGRGPDDLVPERWNSYHIIVLHRHRSEAILEAMIRLTLCALELHQWRAGLVKAHDALAMACTGPVVVLDLADKVDALVNQWAEEEDDDEGEPDDEDMDDDDEEYEPDLPIF